MASEGLVHSPWPQKVVDCPPSAPPSPSRVHFQRGIDSRTTCKDQDDAATKELRDVFRSDGHEKASVVPEQRSLSSASTEYTEATSPPGQSPEAWLTEPSFALPSHEDAEEECTSPPTPKNCSLPGVNNRSWLQERKVFVGGIPQSIDQNGLYQMFSQCGKVKKAWLQHFHDHHGIKQGATARKHRGFGFVIFYEKEAVDGLLGGQSKCFRSFGNGLKLEVKMAIVRRDPHPREMQLLHQGPHDPTSSGDIPVAEANDASVNTSQTRNGFSPPAPASAESSPTHHREAPSCADGRCLIPQPPVVAVPCLPPFPFSNGQAAWQPMVYKQASIPWLLQPSTTPMQFYTPPQSMGAPNAFARSKLPDTQDREALRQALLEAMPDHYED